jgi:dihydropteroate synthase
VAYQTVGLPEPGRCVVMGILNVTPDSFSDAGAYLEPNAAIAHGLDMHSAGADIVDVGGESTRPGAERVSAEEEIRRVVPVITELARAGAYTSIDTTRHEVAEAALEAGAKAVNDVSGGLADDMMIESVAGAEVPYFLMHWRGHSADMQARAVYADVVAEVCDELRQRYEAAVEGGIESARIVLDPGIGFAKTAEHNWALLANLDALATLGRPILIGASRKRFIGALLAQPDGTPRPGPDRDVASAALAALVAAGGAWGVRVHDVRSTLDAVKVAAAVARR